MRIKEDNIFKRPGIVGAIDPELLWHLPRSAGLPGFPSSHPSLTSALILLSLGEGSKGRKLEPLFNTLGEGGMGKRGYRSRLIEEVGIFSEF